MSYILEALKKSEQERELGQVPRLITSQGMATQQRPRWMWAVVGVLLINGLLLAGLLFQQRVPDRPAFVSNLTATPDPGTNATTISLDGAQESEVSVAPSTEVSAPPVAVPETVWETLTSLIVAFESDTASDELAVVSEP